MRRFATAFLAVVMTVSAGALLPGAAVAAPPSLERLKKALLTEAEMPAGYTFESLYLGVEGGAPETGDPCALSAPPSTPSQSYGAMASITFQKGADGPTASEAITITGGKAARAAVERYRHILDRCPSSSGEAMVLVPWTLPKLGDDSVGYVLTLTGDSLRLRTAIVAQGDLLTIFTKMTDKEDDGADLKEIAQSGVKKLQRR